MFYLLILLIVISLLNPIILRAVEPFSGKLQFFRKAQKRVKSRVLVLVLVLCASEWIILVPHDLCF